MRITDKAITTTNISQVSVGVDLLFFSSVTWPVGYCPIVLCHSLQEVNFGKLDCSATSVHQRLDFLFTQAMNQAYKSQEVWYIQ